MNLHNLNYTATTFGSTKLKRNYMWEGGMGTKKSFNTTGIESYRYGNLLCALCSVRYWCENTQAKPGLSWCLALHSVVTATGL
jgi:hypothetical protein